MSHLIDNLSDTALWVAIYRAEESKRPDAWFNDPYARRLAGERGATIARAMDFSNKNSWSFVARTWLFDDYIMRSVKDGCDMVINLAAGLDTRPYRMKLPETLQWVEVDMPAITQYKTEMMADEKPVCKLERVKMDLANRNQRSLLFDRLAGQCRKALVMCEGLVIYLTDEQVGVLADDLSARHSFGRWVFDLQSPGLLVLAQKEMGSKLDDSQTLFKFAPANGELFFEDHGWKWLESRSKLKTAATLNRLNDEMLAFAAYPEPEGPKGEFPWSGVCLFENNNFSS